MWNLKRHSSGMSRGFSLMETLVAIQILALMCTGIVVVMNRCLETVTNLSREAEAMEEARGQMERVLAQASVHESVESGTSDRFPGIEWQTVVEVFDEPVQGTTWAQAVCSSQYEDANGETQTLRLTCWLTRLTEAQLAQLRQLGGDQVLPDLDAAAQYAEVPPETIEQWVDNGLVLTEEGAFLKANLDLYKRTDGQPTDEEKEQQIRSPEELEDRLQDGSSSAEPGQDGERRAVPGSFTPPTSSPRIDGRGIR